MPHVCPWWQVYTFDNALRGLVHNVDAIFGPYVEPGMTALDIGCGRGFTTLALARLVGPEGKVTAVDLQPQMLDMLKKRAEKAGLADRIHLHRCEADSIGIQTQVDFVNAFWMVHEVPNRKGFLVETHSCLHENGKLLIAEPSFHVSVPAFKATVEEALSVGFAEYDEPRVRFSRAAALKAE